MPKKEHETFLEYKSRIIDPVSESFCPSKWLYANIWLNSKKTASCYHCVQHEFSVEEVVKNPQAMHNTAYKKSIRKMMLEGEKPSECEYCFHTERIDSNNLSDRVVLSNQYDEDVIKAISKDPNEDSKLQVLELAFSRACNLSCSYCASGISSAWAHKTKNYLSKIDGDFSFEGDLGRYNVSFEDQVTNIDKEVDERVVDAFFRWWPELSERLKIIRVTGGEPTMSTHFWEFLEILKKYPKPNLKFVLNTNLIVSTKNFEKLISAARVMPNFHLCTSCEGTKAEAEFARNSFDYDQWIKYTEASLQSGVFSSVMIMMSANIFTARTTTSFLNVMLKWKQKYGTEMPIINVNTVDEPRFLSVLILPYYLRLLNAFKIQLWLLKNKYNDYVTDYERESLKRLQRYMLKGQILKNEGKPIEEYYYQFLQFLKLYNRQDDFNKTYPFTYKLWVLYMKIYLKLKGKQKGKRKHV